MQFDGDSIAVGDDVYDMAHGQGKVLEIKSQENRFVVGFGSRRFVYNAEGVGPFSKNQTLFWRYPVVCKPMKSAKLWEIFVQLCSTAATVFHQRRIELLRELP